MPRRSRETGRCDRHRYVCSACGMAAPLAEATAAFKTLGRNARGLTRKNKRGTKSPSNEVRHSIGGTKRSPTVFGAQQGISAMLAALATAAFLATLWMLGVIAFQTFAESCGKIVAALKGDSIACLPGTAAARFGRARQRSGLAHSRRCAPSRNGAPLPDPGVARDAEREQRQIDQRDRQQRLPRRRISAAPSSATPARANSRQLLRSAASSTRCRSRRSRSSGRR